MNTNLKTILTVLATIFVVKILPAFYYHPMLLLLALWLGIGIHCVSVVWRSEEAEDNHWAHWLMALTGPICLALIFCKPSYLDYRSDAKYRHALVVHEKVSVLFSEDFRRLFRATINADRIEFQWPIKRIKNESSN